MEMHPKPFAKGYILPMSFLVFMPQGTTANWKQRLGARIIRAVDLGCNYLHQGKLRQSAELTHSILKCPRLQEVITELNKVFFEFQIIHNFTEVKGISPKECHLNSISKELLALRAEVKDYLVAEGLAVLKPPLWGKDNDLTEWWSINDFEILSACY
jgi:hypothetical protein